MTPRAIPPKPLTTIQIQLNNMTLYRLTLLDFQWNFYNAFHFELLGIETETVNDRALFGLYFSKDFFNLDLLFFKFSVFDKSEEE